MEKKTPSPFKRDIDRAYKRLQLASMVLGNVSEAYDTGDLKEAYRNAFEFAYHAERLTLLARSLPALTGSPAARSSRPPWPPSVRERRAAWRTCAS